MLVSLVTISSFTLASFPVPQPTIAQPRTDSADYRLPTHVLPVHYNVTLEPNLDDFTFSGYVIIQVEVTEAAKNVTLHASELTITNLEILNSSNVTVQYESLTTDDEKEFLSVNFATELAVGTYFIYVTFDGILNSNNNGFYRASYNDAEGNTR